MGILFGMGKWLISAVFSVCVGGILWCLGLSPERWVADVLSGIHPWAYVCFWVIAGALGTIAMRLAIWALWDRRPRAITGAFYNNAFSGARRPPPYAKDNIFPVLVM